MVCLFSFLYFNALRNGVLGEEQRMVHQREQFTFLRVKVSCLLPTAVSAMLLVPECSSNFRRSSREALGEHGQKY